MSEEIITELIPDATAPNADDNGKVIPVGCNTQGTSVAGRAADPLENIAQFRLPANYSASAGVKKLITVVPVTKPDRQWFVRVHPDEAYRLQTQVFIDRETRESYLVVPGLEVELEGDCVPIELYTAINRQKTPFLWPVRLPDADGRPNRWHESAREAAKEAMAAWVKVSSNMGAGLYDVAQAVAQLSDPEWPEMSLDDLIRIGFRGRVIDGPDHPMILRHRGAL